MLDHKRDCIPFGSNRLSSPSAERFPLSSVFAELQISLLLKGSMARC
jgi:hypothetical protein